MSLTLIVSAYYKIPSKQPHSFYVPHLQRWFRSVRAPVIFFTSADVQAEIESWGYPLTHVRFIVLPFEELNAWSLGREFWDRQKVRDPERYHTPELGAVWYEKKEFVRRAMDLVPEASIFIWCDAGCIRNERSAAAARDFGTRHRIVDDLLHIQYSFPAPTQSRYRFPYRCIAGALMAGTRVAWRLHTKYYDAILKQYDQDEVPAIMDQYIIKSCIDAHPEAYAHDTPPPGTDPWFFFLWIL